MRIFLLFFVMCVIGCSGFDGKRVSSEDVLYKEKFVFSDSPEVVFNAARRSIYDLKWEIMYSGDQYPDYNYAGLSYQYLSRQGDANADSWHQIKKESGSYIYKIMQVKTPTSPFSYGAVIYVTIATDDSANTKVSVIAGSSQVNEQKKLDGYVKSLCDQLNKNIEMKN